MNRCFVKDCVSGLPTFYVENDPSVIAQWIEVLPTRERAFDPDSDQVCAAHFAANVISKEPVYILSGGALKIDASRSKTKLTSGAVPTIFKGVLEKDVKSELVEVVVEDHEIIPRITNVTTVEVDRSHGNDEDDSIKNGSNDCNSDRNEGDTLACSLSSSDSNELCQQQPQQQFEKVPETEVKDEPQSRPPSEDRDVNVVDTIQETEVPAISSSLGDQSSPEPAVCPEPQKSPEVRSRKDVVKVPKKSRKRPVIRIKSLASITESTVERAEPGQEDDPQISKESSVEEHGKSPSPSPPLLTKVDNPYPGSKLDGMRSSPPVLQREVSASEAGKKNEVDGEIRPHISCRYRRTVKSSRPRFVQQMSRKKLPKKVATVVKSGATKKGVVQRKEDSDKRNEEIVLIQFEAGPNQPDEGVSSVAKDSEQTVKRVRRRRRLLNAPRRSNAKIKKPLKRLVVPRGKVPTQPSGSSQRVITKTTRSEPRAPTQPSGSSQKVITKTTKSEPKAPIQHSGSSQRIITKSAKSEPKAPTQPAGSSQRVITKRTKSQPKAPTKPSASSRRAITNKTKSQPFVNAETSKSPNLRQKASDPKAGEGFRMELQPLVLVKLLSPQSIQKLKEQVKMESKSTSAKATPAEAEPCPSKLGRVEKSKEVPKTTIKSARRSITAPKVSAVPENRLTDTLQKRTRRSQTNCKTENVDVAGRSRVVERNRRQPKVVPQIPEEQLPVDIADNSVNCPKNPSNAPKKMGQGVAMKRTGTRPTGNKLGQAEEADPTMTIEERVKVRKQLQTLKTSKEEPSKINTYTSLGKTAEKEITEARETEKQTAHRGLRGRKTMVTPPVEVARPSGSTKSTRDSAELGKSLVTPSKELVVKKRTEESKVKQLLQAPPKVETKVSRRGNTQAVKTPESLNEDEKESDTSLNSASSKPSVSSGTSTNEGGILSRVKRKPQWLSSPEWVDTADEEPEQSDKKYKEPQTETLEKEKPKTPPKRRGRPPKKNSISNENSPSQLRELKENNNHEETVLREADARCPPADTEYDSDVLPASPLMDPLSIDGEQIENSSSDVDEPARKRASISSPEFSPTANRKAIQEGRAKASCFVLTCLGKSTKFFHPPRSDTELFDKWSSSIPQRERPFTEKDLVCSDHFKKSCIRSSVKGPWGKLIPLPEYKWKLEPGAVPTVFRSPVILLEDIKKSQSDATPARGTKKANDSQRCVVPGCSGKAANAGRRLTYHEFPFYITYRKLWVREISRKTGVLISEQDEFLFGKKVCGQHFVASDYQGGVRSNPLKLSAVPSRFVEVVSKTHSVPESGRKSDSDNNSQDMCHVDKPERVSFEDVGSKVVHSQPGILKRSSSRNQSADRNLSGDPKRAKNEEKDDDIIRVYESLAPPKKEAHSATVKSYSKGVTGSVKVASVSPNRREIRESPALLPPVSASMNKTKVLESPPKPNVKFIPQSTSSSSGVQNLQQGIYIIDSNSGIPQHLQLISSPYDAFPMYTLVQKPVQHRVSVGSGPTKILYKRMVSANSSAATSTAKTSTPTTIVSTSIGPTATQIKFSAPAEAAHNYVERTLDPVWTTAVSKPSQNSAKSTSNLIPENASAKSVVKVRLGKKSVPPKNSAQIVSANASTPGSSSQALKTASDGASRGLIRTYGAAKASGVARPDVNAKTKESLGDKRDPPRSIDRTSASTVVETEIPPNKMKVFKKHDNNCRYIITKKDGKCVVTPYDGKDCGKIKETFLTPDLGKLMFPSPQEGESIMVVVPESIPMIGIGNTSKSTQVKASPSKPTTTTETPQKIEPPKRPPMAKRTPANAVGLAKKSVIKEKVNPTVETQFTPGDSQLERIYDWRKLLKLPDDATWSIQLLKQKKDGKTEKYIFIAETVLKSDQTVQQRVLKIHNTLKFELFANSSNITPMFNEKDDQIRTFKALQELLDQFATFKVCSGADGFSEIPESSCAEGHRVGSCWYSNECKILSLDSTLCSECASLKAALKDFQQMASTQIIVNENSDFQTEVLFLNPGVTSYNDSPSESLLMGGTIHNSSDLVATTSASSSNMAEQQEGLIFFSLPNPLPEVVTAAQVPSFSPTGLPSTSQASSLSPPLYVFSHLDG